MLANSKYKDNPRSVQAIKRTAYTDDMQKNTIPALQVPLPDTFSTETLISTFYHKKKPSHTAHLMKSNALK
jgi:hypothetical protein